MNYFNTWSGFECHSSEGKPGALGAEGLSVPQYYVESDDQTEQHWNVMGFFLLCLAGLHCLLKSSVVSRTNLGKPISTLPAFSGTRCCEDVENHGFVELTTNPEPSMSVFLSHGAVMIGGSCFCLVL